MKYFLGSASSDSEDSIGIPAEGIPTTRGVYIDDEFLLNCNVDKFKKALKVEQYDSPYKEDQGLDLIISVQECLQLHRKQRGDTKDSVAALCNGEYTPDLIPLHFAIARHDGTEFAEALLQYGADVNKLNPENGKTALDYANWRSEYQRPKRTKLILSYGGKTADELSGKRKMTEEESDEDRQSKIRKVAHDDKEL
ncbi:ankyrin repeat domain-containing protein [Candidatus Babeliales bacterium]|nr:ankyrin repeat domain-containing protein [Candidatus Babeliales bacterium]MBP9843951.1 ankyrin repeat domain-containing protein [Candidatus Babeliales bacterium]